MGDDRHNAGWTADRTDDGADGRMDGADGLTAPDDEYDEDEGGPIATRGGWEGACRFANIVI